MPTQSDKPNSGSSLNIMTIKSTSST